MADQKDTIYIDIDDEITTIIEKVRASEQKIVALVLPKRASVLQSVVNMKLLKRTAEAAKKSLVLITTEAGLLPLAGTVGLYVARNLQTKPEIPVVDGGDADDEIADLDEPEDDTDFDPADVADRSVGELAVSSSVPLVGKAAAGDPIETLELDDDAASVATPAAAATKAPKVKKPKKDKKLAVPNFESFRKKLLIGVPILIILVIVLFVAGSALPKAEITITTDTSNINSSLAVTIDTSLKAANVAKLTIPAQLQKLDKAGQQQVATTGKKNKGEKASGSVKISTACTKKPASVGPGVGVTTSGLTFITTDTLTFSSIDVDGGGDFVCSGAVPVVAQTGGANYNVAANSKFTMASYGYGGTNGAAFTGGTDNIVQIVSQADIDGATQKITAQNSDSMKQQLTDQLKQATMYPLAATFTAGTPNTTVSSQVGDEASTVTVSQTTTYTMFGVKEADLKALVDADIKDKIDPSKQSILSEGLDKAAFKVNSATATSAQLAMTTVATAGPDLKADELKTRLAGMKKGEIRDTLTSDPGVTDVQVHFSPFWVTSVPKKADKVTITFQKSQE